MLNYMPLNGFALEPAVTLPPSAPAQRTSTSAGGGVSWAPATELRSIQQRPAFFEGAFTQQQQQQQQQYQATPASNATSTPYYSNYTPSPLAQGQTPLPAYTSTPTPAPAQSFAPASGSSGVSFVPFLERDDKNEVIAFQSFFCRPEWTDRSPEEVRLEDYVAAGVVPPLPATVAPGPVDMGLQMPQLQQQQSQPQAQQSAFGQSFFAQQQQPSPPGGLFGTASVGLFPAAVQQQQQPPQSTLSVFGASPFQQAQQPQQQQSFFGQQQQPAAPQSVFTSAFGSQQQQQQSIPQWGTATAGFGVPAGWGASAPSSAWGSNNLFAQAQFQQQQQGQQQQPSAFSSPFGSPFGQQQTFQQQPSAFGFPQQQQSAFGFPVCDQIPQSASFYWLDSSEHCFQEWLRTLPASIGTVSFGGVSVALPSAEQCRAQRECEKERIAKCDADPYGLHLIQSGQIVPPPQEAQLAPPELQSQQSGGGGGGGGSTPASPLRRGSSSPGVQSSPARAPLIPTGSTLHPPSPGTPGLHGRSISLSASLHHSPRLGPLPESPYLDSAASGALLAAASSSPLLGSRSLHGHASAPERRGSNAHMLSSLHAYGHAPLHPTPSSVLFGSQQDASHHSPSRPLRTTHDVQLRTSREMQWAARLVE